MSVKEVKLSIERFLKEVLGKENANTQITEVCQVEGGWDARVELVEENEYYKALGHPKLYDKHIYEISLDDDLEVRSCSRIGEKQKHLFKRIFSRHPPKEKMPPPPEVDKNGLKEMVKETAKQVAKEVAKEVTREIGSLKMDEGTRKKENEEGIHKKEAKKDAIKLKETFIDPGEKVKLEHNFDRIGTVERSESDVDGAVDSLKGLKPKGGKHGQ